MLIDKYLPTYHFNEFHSIKLESGENIYQQILNCDFGNNSLIRFLFKLRGMPAGIYKIENLTTLGFIKLEESIGTEILYGIVTNSPAFNSCQSNISSKDFIINSEESIIKAVINFRVQSISNSKHVISTETRVWCGSKQMRKKFGLYWFFVRPFSQLVRRSMLKEMKLQILKTQNH